MGRVFVPAIEPPSPSRDGIWIVVDGNRVLVENGRASHPTLAAINQLAELDDAHYLGELDGEAVWTAHALADVQPPDGHEFLDLLSLHARTDEEGWMLAGRAVQITEWSRTHRFCGRCGVENDSMDGERARRCPKCRLMVFPRLSPAVIMLVHRGDEILLARGVAFRSPMYSALAGFVEPGETIEQAVRREVSEEVGIEVGEVAYQDSQPWPFPNSLMLGFLAEYVSGEIKRQESEIVDANWYNIRELPNIPGPISISHHLIVNYVQSRLGS
jgi:NAD+ diphosphatase